MFMKRKIADRPNTKRILEKKYAHTHIHDNIFEGDISILCMDKVREPLIIQYEQRDICIIGDGHTWIQHFPKNTYHSMTTMIDENDHIVQFYFDIAKDIGRTETGIPYMDDLYLDVVYMPNEKPFLLDEDELDDALDSKIITQHEHDIAHKEAEQIMQDLLRGTQVLVNNFDNHYQHVKKCL